MSHKRIVGVLLGVTLPLLSAMGLLFASAASATPAMPTPTQIADPANWTVTTSIGPVRQVSPAEAYAAMQQPGAQTNVVDGLTLRQAVGLDPIPPSKAAQLGPHAAATTAAAVGATSTQCWSSTVSKSWSFWPLQMTLADDAYWCGVYNWSITSFSHNVRQPAGSGSYCGPAGTSWSQVYGFYSGSPIREYNDYGTWNCMGVYQSHSYQANVSSSGAHWIS